MNVQRKDFEMIAKAIYKEYNAVWLSSYDERINQQEAVYLSLFSLANRLAEQIETSGARFNRDIFLSAATGGHSFDAWPQDEDTTV